MSLVNLVIGAVVLAVGVLIGQLLRTVGISWTVGIPWLRPTPICDDPGPPGCGSNPRQCGTSQAIVFGPGGDLAEYPDCGEGPATVVVAHEGSRGLESSMRAQLMFSPSPEIEVTVMHFGNPGRVEAFDTTGSLVEMVVMGPTANVEQKFTLRATAITRVDVTAGSPTDPVLIIGWCH